MLQNEISSSVQADLLSSCNNFRTAKLLLPSKLMASYRGRKHPSKEVSVLAIDDVSRPEVGEVKVVLFIEYLTSQA